MRPERSLRGRFLWAQASIVVVLLLAFALAIAQFVDVLENELLERVVRSELDALPGHVGDEDIKGDRDPDGLRRWSIPATEQRDLPEPLREMTEGVQEIAWDDGSDVFAGKLVVDGHIYALVAEFDDVERLESRLLGIGFGTALIAIVLAILFAVWLSRAALRPISTLVERLKTLDPTHPQPLLEDELQTAEVRLIAGSFDAYQSRITTLLDREKSLTDDISHELRTPTSVITTAAELLLDDPEVADITRERVERIARAARRTESVLEAILFLGRDDSVNISDTIDMRSVVSDTIAVYRPLARAKGLDLVADYAADTNRRAPPGAAAIVLRNLLDNAIRYTDRGSVRVVLSRDRLVVEDTGRGLADVDPNRIFERGYRSDASPGSGLGLDLVRRVCDRVGWTVSAHQPAAGGSRFEVSFTDAAPRAALN